MNVHDRTEFKSCDYEDELLSLQKYKFYDVQPTYDSILPIIEKMPSNNFCDEECAASSTSSSSKSCICLDCEFQEYQYASMKKMTVTPITLSTSSTFSSPSDSIVMDRYTQLATSMNLNKRFHMELSSTYDLFSLQEDENHQIMIHVRNTFAPVHWMVPLYRWFWWCMAIRILQKDHEISIHIRNGSNLMYFSHFTNITMLVTILYQTLSTVLSISSIVPKLRKGFLYQPTDIHSRPSTLVCWTWMIYTISLISEFVVCLGYWLCEYGGPSSVPVKERSSNLYKHLMIGFLLYMDGCIIGRIPLRMKHLFHVISYGALYTLYSIVFSYYQLGTEKGDIYRFIDWHNDPVDALLFSIVFGLVAAPVIFIIFWMESSSTYGFFSGSPRGSKRRCTIVGNDS